MTKCICEQGWKKPSTPCSVAWENSWHLARSPLEPSQNDIWVMSAEILYWWYATLKVLLIGWNEIPSHFNQTEALPRSGYWHVISMEFLRLLLRRRFARAQVVTSQDVSCFLRLHAVQFNSLKCLYLHIIYNKETHFFNKFLHILYSICKTYDNFKFTLILCHLKPCLIWSSLFPWSSVVTFFK